jgi:molecular chaperone GrpE
MAMASIKASSHECSPPIGGDDEAQAAKEGVGEVATLRAANADLEDRLMRAVAETENIRKRGERAADEMRRYANSQFAREMLAVLDNLNRALAAADGSAPREGEDTSLIEGVRATERMLTKALRNFGVRKIDALGAQFNPELHEAVMKVEDGSHVPGIVTDVIEDGYTLHDRLLRPARVAVAGQKPLRSEPSQA